MTQKHGLSAENCNSSNLTVGQTGEYVIKTLHPLKSYAEDVFCSKSILFVTYQAALAENYWICKKLVANLLDPR